jgi:hypothetical protein
VRQNKRSQKEDIEKAERDLLIISWLGIISTVAVIVSLMLRSQ